MNEIAKVAYASGFFDGEGHIQIRNHSKRGSYMLSITAVQATPYPLTMFVELFGGTVSKRFTEYRATRRALFTWQSSSKQAEEALRRMMPYLVVKKDEAEVALRFRATFRPQYGERSKNSPEVEAAREEMMYLLQRMRVDKRAAHVTAAA